MEKGCFGHNTTINTPLPTKYGKNKGYKTSVNKILVAAAVNFKKGSQLGPVPGFNVKKSNFKNIIVYESLPLYNPFTLYELFCKNI